MLSGIIPGVSSVVTDGRSVTPSHVVCVVVFQNYNLFCDVAEVANRLPLHQPRRMRQWTSVEVSSACSAFLSAHFSATIDEMMSRFSSFANQASSPSAGTLHISLVFPCCVRLRKCNMLIVPYTQITMSLGGTSRHMVLCRNSHFLLRV